jgi:hypothetical protein
MKNLLRYGFTIILASISLFGCKFISNKKILEFENGGFITKIVIIDNNKKKTEYSIDSGWSHGWSEDIVGDFAFIYIRTENDIEGLFIVNNEYKKKLLPYDIISLAEYKKRIIAESEYNKIMSYDISIKIVKNRFEIEYDDTKFNIVSYFSYNENYSNYKRKYIAEYNLKE